MLVYVNDVLQLAKYVQEDVLNLNQIYLWKEGFGPPDEYPGVNVDKFQLEDGRTVWSMTCFEYICGAINNVDLMLKGNKADLKSFGGGHDPYPSSYRPELDVTDDLDAELTNRFKQLVGVLRWSI